MSPALARQIDRWVIWHACRSVDTTAESPTADMVQRAFAALTDPAFLTTPRVEPAKLLFVDRRKFQFPSPVQTPWSANNVVPGRLYPTGLDWTRRPAVLLLHGWNAERQYQWQFPYLASRLNRVGVNAVMFELPYHGKRKPTEPGAVRNFISEDVFRVAEATRQAVAEIRSALAWVKAQGCPRVGLWGLSFGGWLSGLVAGLDRSADFAVLMTPIIQMERALQELPFCKPVARAFGELTGQLHRLNPVNHPPRCGVENILIVKSEYDLFAPGETIEAFWETCGRPEIWRLPHGHISVLLSLPVMQRVVGWIGRRAAP